MVTQILPKVCLRKLVLQSSYWSCVCVYCVCTVYLTITYYYINDVHMACQ